MTTKRELHRSELSDRGILDELLTVRLRRASMGLSAAFARVTTAHELKIGAVSSLALIIANPGISQSELAVQIRTDKSRIVAVVDLLEREGLAYRVQSDADRRRRALHATPKGVAFLDQLIGEVRALEDTLLSAVPAEELARFEQTLAKISSSFGRDGFGDDHGPDHESNIARE